MAQTSIRAGSFVRTPSLLVLSMAAPPDATGVRDSLSAAIETLWSTSRLGVDWQTATAGRQNLERLNGLGALYFAIRGNLLFLANDSALMAAALHRLGTAPAGKAATYTAEFRHSAATRDYLSIMRALECGQAPQPFFFVPQGGTTPRFFLENLASLSATFGFVRTEVVTAFEERSFERQTVVYR